MTAGYCGYTYVCLCVFKPQPLAFLEEDIREVLKQETGADIFNRADIQSDFRSWKHNVSVVCTFSSSQSTKILRFCQLHLQIHTF